MTRPFDPIPFSACSAASGATVVWRHRGKLSVTIVSKATFALVSGVMTPLAPEPIARTELTAGLAGLVQPDDLAPFLSRADVWVAGQRTAPSGEARTARLAISRGEVTLLDKRVVIDARDAAAPFSAFAPLSRHWPIRTKLLKATPASKLEGSAIAVPDSVDWRYFQTAPADQQITYLEGREVLLLDGLYASDQRIEARLPALRAEASLEESGQPTIPIRMVFDALGIDLERRVCSVIFRGHAKVTGPLERARIERSFQCGASPSIPPARPDFAATTRVEEADIAGYGAPPPSGRPSAPPSSGISPSARLAETAMTANEEIAALRRMYATPFEAAKATGAPSPPAAPSPRSIETPPELTGTAVVAADEVLALRAMFATPFEAAKVAGISAPVAPPTPPKPPPADLGSTAIVGPEVVGALRAAHATPFVAPAKTQRASVPPPPVTALPASTPVAPVMASPIAHVAPAVSTPSSFVSTAFFDQDEVAALRAQFATPFDNPFRKAARGAEAPVAPAPRDVSPLPSASLGQTGALDSDEVRAIREKYAPAFHARIRVNEPNDAEAERKPKRVGSSGACFLAALAEYGVRGFFDLGVDDKGGRQTKERAS